MSLASIASDGSVAERYVYDPYGQRTIYDGTWNLVTWNQSKQNEILYTGHRLDPETGLYVTLYRYYHPPLGRWTSRDPIGYDSGGNLYAYCRSGPVDLRDPQGLTAALAAGSSETIRASAWIQMFGLSVSEDYGKTWLLKLSFESHWRCSETGELIWEADKGGASHDEDEDVWEVVGDAFLYAGEQDVDRVSEQKARLAWVKAQATAYDETSGATAWGFGLGTLFAPGPGTLGGTIVGGMIEGADWRIEWNFQIAWDVECVCEAGYFSDKPFVWKVKYKLARQRSFSQFRYSAPELLGPRYRPRIR
jgi:RHS repeat-associated protein